jgi:hypothetical protein
VLARETAEGAVSAPLPDSVADLDLAKTPELADLACRHRWTLHSGAVLEDGHGSHLVRQVGAERQPVASAHGAREHSDVSDLLATSATFDLEDAARDGTVSIPRGRREQLGEARHQCIHARSGDRRAGEDGIHQGAPGLNGQLIAEAAIGDGRLVLHVRGQQTLVALGQDLRQPGPEPGVTGPKRREAGAAGPEGSRVPHLDDSWS